MQEVLAGSHQDSDAARIALTLQSLPKAHQRAISQLSIFPSTFDEEGAAQVCLVSYCLLLPAAAVAAAACGWLVGWLAGCMAGWLAAL